MKFAKLHPDAKAPSKAYPGDAGWDLTAVSKTWDSSHEFFEYDTGLAIRVPEGHVGLLFPRSSVSKTSLILANCVGVLDHAYCGPVKFRFKLLGHAVKADFSPGDRIGQLVVIKFNEEQFEEVEELKPTERGSGGFGSSGK